MKPISHNPQLVELLISSATELDMGQMLNYPRAVSSFPFHIVPLLVTTLPECHKGLLKEKKDIVSHFS